MPQANQSDAFPKTARNTVKRIPKRGEYDRATIYPIIDAALVCHVGFVVDEQPYVIPTIHARREDTLLLHGSTASRLLKQMGRGAPLCITFTHLDGLVLARSTFHSSMNYRSAVVFGQGRLLESEAEKLAALTVLTEHLLPGRWADTRQPTPLELKGTSVVEVTIESASAKIRTGPPADDEEDYGLPIWAGVLPLEQRWLAPLADPRLGADITLPAYLQSLGG